MATMKLWKKESKKPNAFYVNIFVQRNQEWLNRCYESTRKVDRSMPPKNDTIAEQKRKLGNVAFGKHKWSNAMKLYNDSLRNAEKGSEHISLAYAKRSACFFHLKMYNECLVDIELAKATGYPDHLMPKLDRRTTDCLERIAEAGIEPDDFGLKLSYDPDEKFPCLANVIKIEQNADGDYIAYAKEDIEVGKTIVVEQAFSTYLFRQYGWRCNICLKTATNLVPCENCAIAMFCKDSCTGHHLHESECGLKFSKDNLSSGIMMHNVRITLMAINMFANVDELMTFVEEMIASDQNELPDNLSDEKSKYRAFLKLSTNEKLSELNNFVATTFCVYQIVLDIQKVRSMFRSEKHRRFLMHLVANHVMISGLNTIQTTTTTGALLNKGVPVCCHTLIMKRFFKHSCAPNVLRGDRDGKSVFITIRPINKGDQLHTFALEVLQEPKQKRQQMLLEHFLICNCSRCEGETVTPEQRRALAADPDYRRILVISVPKDNDESRAPIDKCAAFLNKHGRVSWCPELGNVIEVYTGLLRIRLNGTIDDLSWLDMELDELNLTDK